MLYNADFSVWPVVYVCTDSSEVRLDPDTAHLKLIISTDGDSATYTDIRQQLPDLPGRFDTTLNVISLQGVITITGR